MDHPKCYFLKEEFVFDSQSVSTARPKVTDLVLQENLQGLPILSLSCLILVMSQLKETFCPSKIVTGVAEFVGSIGKLQQ